jgi:hypothetical protein
VRSALLEAAKWFGELRLSCAALSSHVSFTARAVRARPLSVCVVDLQQWSRHLTSAALALSADESRLHVTGGSLRSIDV